MKAFPLLNIFFLFFLMAMVLSCKDKFENDSGLNEAAKNYHYFPLDSGSYIIYDVDSIVHDYADDNTANPDSIRIYYHFQLKEKIDSSFTDGQGKKAWYVSRYKRMNDTSSWQFQNVWVAQTDEYSAQRVEDNMRYIKLALPVLKGKTWNGNAYNTIPEENYSYTEVHVPLSIAGFSFDSSVTVLQKEDINLIHQIFKQEKYVSGLGMVYKEVDSLNLNGYHDTTNGFEYRMTLKDYFPN